MTLAIRFRHKLSFKGQPQNKYLGDVLTLSDSDFKVSSELIIHSTVKYGEYPAYKNGRVFLLSAPKDKENNNEVTKLYSFLEQNKHKAVLIYFDSAGSFCLMGVPDVHDTLEAGGRCFKCYVIEFKQPEKPITTIGLKLSISDSATEQTLAAAHYDGLVRDKTSRHQSQIYHLRNLNNFLKTELINLAAEYALPNKHDRDVKVIDFGCGMGGDIFKWFKNPKGLGRYVGVDIARNSLVQFTERLKGAQNARMDIRKVTHLIHADIGVESLSSSVLETHTWKEFNNGALDDNWSRQIALPQNGANSHPLNKELFDVASCQFAIHYMFQSESKAHHFFEEVSSHLKPGGVFIVTTIDCRVITELLQQAMYGLSPLSQSSTTINSDLKTKVRSPSNSIDTATNGHTVENGSNDESQSSAVDPFASIRAQYLKQSTALINNNPASSREKSVDIRNDLGHIILNMKFANDMAARLTGNSSDVTPYGIKYTFTLHDQPDTAAVDAPEWIVPLGPPLHALAEAHDMKVDQVVNFQDMVANAMLTDLNKIDRMEQLKIFNYKGSLSQAEWDIARLYTGIIFRKNGGTTPSSPQGPPPPRAMFVPSSPEGPPPPRAKFVPSSPEGPPPPRAMFVPSSPEGPPPPRAMFVPSSPEGPPPPRAMFVPSSPEGPPPPRAMFVPSSPDGPPPPRAMFAPSSPEGPPPPRAMFAPSSPEGPPPPRAMFAPSSPEGPPPPRAMFAPSSPDGPPPPRATFATSGNDSDDDDMDEDTLRLVKVRSLAVDLAGGQDRWDMLDEDTTEHYMREAQLKCFGGSTTHHFEPYSPSGAPPVRNDVVDSEEWQYTPRGEELGSVMDEEIDADTAFLLKVRDHAILLAGGTEAWDVLDDDERDTYQAAAREAFTSGDMYGSNFPPSLQLYKDSSNMGSPQEPSAPVSHFYDDDDDDDGFGSNFSVQYNAPLAPINQSGSATKRMKTVYDSDSDDEPVARKTKTKYDSDTEIGCSPATSRESMRTSPRLAINNTIQKSTSSNSVDEIQRKQLQRVRNTAIDMSGGEKEWALLDPSVQQSMMVEAEEQLRDMDKYD